MFCFDEKREWMVPQNTLCFFLSVVCVLVVVFLLCWLIVGMWNVCYHWYSRRRQRPSDQRSVVHNLRANDRQEEYQEVVEFRFPLSQQTKHNSNNNNNNNNNIMELGVDIA
jgi:hypothetical protein